MKVLISFLAISLFMAIPLSGDNGEIINLNCGFLQGRPKAQCEYFFLVESRYLHRVADSEVREGKSGFLFEGELAFMHNFYERLAIGAGFSFGGNDDMSVVGLMPRLRFWRTEKVYVDIAAGFMFPGESNYRNVKSPGFASSLSVGYSDFFAVMARYDLARYEDISFTDEGVGELIQGTQHSFYLGVKAGSYFVLAVPVGILIAYAATAD